MLIPKGVFLAAISPKQAAQTLQKAIPFFLSIIVQTAVINCSIQSHSENYVVEGFLPFCSFFSRTCEGTQ